jgi:hypothetical protein
MHLSFLAYTDFAPAAMILDAGDIRVALYHNRSNLALTITQVHSSTHKILSQIFRF